MALFKKFALGASVATLAALAPIAAVHAQATSAQLRGTITDASGAPIDGAVVTIVHQPSGTAAQATTSAGGTFFESGLRVGGPYTISVVAPGFEADVIDGLILEPGRQRPLEIALASATVETIVVRGQATNTLDLNNGVGSTFSAADIRNQPALNRDLIATLLRDPLASSDGEGNISIAGANPRFNALAIDGALLQDDFGLSSSTYPSNRSPINLDAIQSASIVASDYSVTNSGFRGGLVNVVTKSGTNEFDGAIFYEFSNDSLVGTEAFGGERTFNPGNFDTEEYGISVGGPIIKDRLFFFVSYDEFENSSGADFSASDESNGRTQAFFDGLNQVFLDTYGIDLLGRPQQVSLPQTSERLLAKIDWNINDNHRASFTYQDTQETELTSISATEFQGAWYNAPQEVTTYTAQLFSDWTPNLSTTFRVNFKDNVRDQLCLQGQGVGEIRFDIDPADLVGSPLEGTITDDQFIIAGCDRFRHANEFSDERLQVFGSADYQIGDHVITLGGSYENYALRNVFVAGSNGIYEFGSYNDIINQTADIAYFNVPSNDARADGAAEWEYNLISLFIEDEWQVLPSLVVNGGIRWELFQQNDTTPARPDVQALIGEPVENNLDGLDIIMPRVGFRWEPTERTTVSGGFGLFAGGQPNVWISNAFQPVIFNDSIDGVVGADPRNIPQSLITSIANSDPTDPAFADILSQDFDIPSDWKGSLRFDQEFDMNFRGLDLGDDYLFTAQYLYTNVNRGFRWENFAQTRIDATQPTGVAPDGRPIYADLQDLGIENVTALTNFEEGRGHVISVALAKVYDMGVGFNVSYAFQDVENVTPGTSSRGISNLRAITDADINNPGSFTSPFEVRHAFKVNLSYEQDLLAFASDNFEGLNTRIDVFGQIFSGDPFTYTFDVQNNNALFGRPGSFENPFDNAPVYIPTGPTDPLVVYESGFDTEGFFNLVNELGIPSGINERNADRGPWNQRWDLQFRQDLPGVPGADRYVGDNRFQFYVNIENFLNLLNNEWGTTVDAPSNNDEPIVEADLVSAADVAALGVDNAPALTGDAPRTTCTTQGACLYRFTNLETVDTGFEDTANSVWRVRFGFRYEF